MDHDLRQRAGTRADRSLARGCRPRPGEGPQRKHYITNIIIKLADDGRASARSDYLVIRESQGGLIPVMGGTYLDAFIKHDGVWLFLRKELVHNIAGDMGLKNER
jgi:3-phenylpropionate/cinnamic acid dioxygenase small subunit